MPKYENEIRVTSLIIRVLWIYKSLIGGDKNMEFSEYTYVDGMLINDAICIPIEQLRKDFANDCYGLAQLLTMIFMNSGVLASVVTFKNGHSLNLKVKDLYNDRINTYPYHSVIMLGNCVIDLLHSDKYISTTKYVKELKKLNPELRLDLYMTEQWYDLSGLPMMLNIDILENYRLK